MVRLLRTLSRQNNRNPLLSIPQWCDCCPEQPNPPEPTDNNFQSHNGAIAAQLKPMGDGVICLTFNPTMVRLLPGMEFVFGVNRCCFQSHNSAIAAGLVGIQDDDV